MTATTTIPLEGIMTFLNSMSLSAQNKRWLGEHLIEQAAKEESMADDAPHTKRVAKVKRRVNSPSDEELERRMTNPAPARFPETDISCSEIKGIIDANSGRLIKGLERWL